MRRAGGLLLVLAGALALAPACGGGAAAPAAAPPAPRPAAAHPVGMLVEGPRRS